MMEQTPGIRQRAEMPEKTKWRLCDIFPTVALWEEEFARAKALVDRMPEVQQALSPEKASILRTLQEVSALSLLVDRLFSYARMLRDEDSRETVPQALADRAESLAVRASAASAFVNPALLAMPEALLRGCLEDPAFSDHDRTLLYVLRNRPHTLNAEQEALLAEAGEVGGAPDTIYTLFTQADLTFPSITGSDGKPTDVSEARLYTLLTDRDGRVRKDAYETVMGTYGKFGNGLSAMYAASVKNDAFRARARKFPSAIEASLFASEIPPKVYDALLCAIDERLPALNRYLSAKQKAMGLSEMHLWDLYVDPAKEFDLKLSYDEAYDLVLATLSPLGEDYVRTVREAKDHRWIDVYENAGKAHGAYSWGCYGTHPFVLLNFAGTLDDASTLAHELGHALHSHYSNRAQPYPKAGYTIFAAEVASTVNEILLSQHLLNTHTDRAAQQSLLNALLEHYRTTVFRQTLFASFERETHAMQERGEALTKEALCDLYYGINQKFYGASCVVDEAVRHEWMRIPHFYSAFYVYQYATGFSAAVCVARKILREGAPAVKGYLEFLSAGGALPPIDALRLCGVDMETPEPVREALDWFEEMLERFEQVC